MDGDRVGSMHATCSAVAGQAAWPQPSGAAIGGNWLPPVPPVGEHVMQVLHLQYMQQPQPLQLGPTAWWPEGTHSEAPPLPGKHSCL